MHNYMAQPKHQLNNFQWVIWNHLLHLHLLRSNLEFGTREMKKMFKILPKMTTAINDQFIHLSLSKIYGM